MAKRRVWQTIGRRIRSPLRRLPGLAALVPVAQHEVTLFDVLNKNLSPPYDLSAFMKYCSKVYVQELLEFWHAVEVLHSTPGSAVIAEVHRIYEVYVADNAPRQINVSHAERKEVEKRLPAKDKNDVNESECSPSSCRHIFDSCQSIVFELLNDGIFPRYLDSIQANLATATAAV